MTIQEVTAQLARLYESGRRYRFVSHAHAVLAAAPAAPELALLTFRALVEMGLGGPARELLELRPDIGDENQRADLKTAVAGLANGRVVWADQRTTFERNIEALVGCRPALREIADIAPDLLAGLQLHQTVDGRQFLSRREPGRLRTWLADLTSVEEDADASVPPRGKLGPAAIVGIRSGATLKTIRENTQRLFLTYSHPLYLIEPEPSCLAAWLHCGDHTELLGDERVYVLVGAEAVDQLEKLLGGNDRLSLPGLVVNFHGDAATASNVHKVVERVSARRRGELAQVQAELAERYRDRDTAYWAQRWQHPNGVVLGMTSRFTTMLQYSMRDTLHALVAQGYTGRVTLESNDYELIPPVELCRLIQEHDPAMIVCLDHLRYEYPFLPKNLPFLCWIQDPMPNLLCRKAGESIGDLDFVCGYYDNRCTQEFGYPRERFEFTNIPVSTRVFHDGPLDAATFEKYACDICFVSNASMPVEQVFRNARNDYPEQYLPLLQRIYERVVALLADNDHLDFQTSGVQLVQSLAQDMGVSLDDGQLDHIKTHFAYRIFDWGRRQQTLEWVAAWARRTGRLLRIYGRGWENHPTLAEFAAGVLDHGEPLRCAYRASKLALQLIPEGFRHQRSLETLASGTLPLVRYCPVDFANLPMETFIAEREAGMHADRVAAVFDRLERVVFRNAEEFGQVAELYLGDDTKRDEVLSEFRAVVLRDYTYEAVMQRVMGAFRGAIAASAETALETCPA